LESNKIGDLIKGLVLLAIAILMAVLLIKVYIFMVTRGIDIKDVIYFPIALIGAICWLTYRGIKAVVSALRDND
jgi:hypothetical protein